MDTKWLVSMWSDFTGIDLIGDVHGCASLLIRLLERLGYTQDRDGVWSHPERRVLFLGDLLDRGPEIVETIDLARRMVSAGHAEMILGNHEISALNAFFMRGEVRIPRIHKETIEQYSSHHELWRETLKWLLERPLCIVNEHFRAVHACWPDSLAKRFLEAHPNGRIDRGMLIRSNDPQSLSHQLFNILTRGPQLRLPEHRSMLSRDGTVRRTFRTSFWHKNPEFYQDVVFQPDPLPDDIAERPLDEDARRRLVYYGEDEPPLFFGHYWREGTPSLIRPNLVCLDYSGVKGGSLVAYRFDGEKTLDNAKLVWVDADESRAPQD